MERTVAAFGDFKAEDRVAGAELLQKEAARLRREEREAAKAAAEAVSDGEDDDEEDGEDEDEDGDGDGEDGEDGRMGMRRWFRTTTPRTRATAMRVSSYPARRAPTRLRRGGRGGLGGGGSLGL